MYACLVRSACLVLLMMLALGPAAADDSAMPEIEHATEPRDGWLIGGQPEPHHLVEARETGVRHVLNARGPDEFEDWDQRALIESLGLEYHRIPIAGEADLDREAVEAFDQALERIGSEGALMHCASGNRIGALFALREAWIQGEDTETAIDVGQAHGLTGLEATVRSLLAE